MIRLFPRLRKRERVLALLAIVSLLIVSCRSREVYDPSGLALSWQWNQNDYEGKSQFLSTLTMTNNGSVTLPPAGWKLYFNLRYHGAELRSQNPALEIRRVNGELFCVVPSPSFTGLTAAEKTTLPFTGRGRIANYQDVPSGFFFVNDTEPEKAMSLKDPTIVPDDERKLPQPDAGALCDQQSNTIDIPERSLVKVVPTPVSYRETNGVFALSPSTALEHDPLFANEAAYLKDQLTKLFGAASSNTASNKIVFRKSEGAAGSYKLSVTPASVTITSPDTDGIFYGIQSLQSLFPADAWNGQQQTLNLPTVEVGDAPRFPWRAFMLDVARNFTPKQKILKLLDVMSLYKMNVFHFHLNDDEGWRLEIPGLPELTEVGAVRGYPFDSGERLQPSYGSGPGDNDSLGTGFYSRRDFIEILKYAAQRHIRVVPEIESPGHARAAVKSMEHRYRKLAAAGKATEAAQYRLHDPEDRSVYVSAQLFNDNVMNAALPSTYAFIEKVVDEIQGMYREAGAPLEFIHMGGDEVPEGAWEGSPAVQQLLRADPAVKDLRGLWKHFFVRVRDILKTRGLALYGWEELVMEKASLEGSRTISANADFIRDGGMVDAWWNDKPNEGTPYNIANAGYRTVLTCFDYFYFDLSNLPSFDEPGDAWVGYLDVRKTFSFIPFDYYRNDVTSMRGERYPENYFKDKPKLRGDARKNIAGIQGALWAENLTAPDLFEYQVLPRLMAVAERGWAKDPDWATASAGEYERAFNRSWSVFANVLGKRELPKLDFYHGGYGYRVPPPGVKIVNGKIVANTLFPGMIIRYTTDGSEPTTNSTRYREPVVARGVIHFKCFTTSGRASADIRVEN